MIDLTQAEVNRQRSLNFLEDVAEGSVRELHDLGMLADLPVGMGYHILGAAAVALSLLGSNGTNAVVPKRYANGETCVIQPQLGLQQLSVTVGAERRRTERRLVGLLPASTEASIWPVGWSLQLSGSFLRGEWDPRAVLSSPKQVDPFKELAGVVLTAWRDLPQSATPQSGLGTQPTVSA